MRDAFGGAFSIKLMLIFLILYVSFICVAINYARAFRVKNKIIDMIEQKEGYAETDNELNEKIGNYLAGSGYHIEYTDVSSVTNCTSSFIGFNGPHGRGYCIVDEGEYYLVETYMVFHLPIIQITFPIPVRGETRVIE